MKYEEQIKKARETGEGIGSQFKEKSTHEMEKNDCCPHCGAYNGYKKDEDGKVIYSKEKIGGVYEIPSDIEWMCNNTGYSWTEDCKCANCDKMYSQNNGC